MKRIITISAVIALMLITNFCFGQAQQEMPKWYKLYTKIYQDNPESDLESPSSLSTNFYKTAVDNGEAQLTVFEYPQVISELSEEQIVKLGLNPNEELNEIEVISSLAITIPNLNHVLDEGILKLKFDDTNYLNSLTEGSELPGIESIQITNPDGILFSSDNEEDSSIDYQNLFGKNLTLNINYNDGSLKQLPVRTTESKTLFNFKDNPWNGNQTDEESEEDGPIGGDPEDDAMYPGETPFDPYTIGIPPFTPCSDANYEETITSRDPWLGHPLYNPSYGGSSDFFTYTSNANPGVFNQGNPALGQMIASYYINPIHDQVTNPIILVDGLDPGSSRKADAVLELFGGSAMLNTLFNAGYDLIIADFKGGADYMQKNAFVLQELIRDLHHDQNVEEIAAIFGPSMSGQVVRYALMHWEENLVDDPDYGEYNIPLFVSIDSPWLGANVPASIICASKKLKDDDDDMKDLDLMVNSPAARQMLIHHYDDGYDARAHLWKTEFYNEMKAWGDFPKNTRIVATANGANHHVGFTSNAVEGRYVSPGEKIFEKEIDWSGDLHIFSILDDEKLAGIPWQSDIHTKSTIINRLDSAPGSGFHLEERLSGIDGITVHSSFCFIPTFSALGIEAGLDNPYINTTNLPTPYFDKTFKGLTNNLHLEDDGFVNFIFEELAPVYGQGLSLCESLEYYYEYGGGLFGQEDSEYRKDIFFSLFPLTTSDEIEIICSNNLFTSLGPQIEMTVLENTCDLDISWSNETYQPTVHLTDGFGNPFGDIEKCFIETELCITHPLCPEFEECEIIKWNLNVNFILGFDIFMQTENDIQTMAEINTLSEAESDFEKMPFNKLNVYPNPSNGLLYLELLDGENLVEVYSMDGKLVSRNIYTSQSKIEQTLDKGVYLIKVTNKDTQKVETKKVIII